MKRRILSLLVATVILIGLMPMMTFAAISPDTTGEVAGTDAWDYGFAISDWSTFQYMTQYGYNISPNTKYAGSNSIHLYMESDGDSSTNDRFAFRKQNILSEGNTYKLSYMLKLVANEINEAGNPTAEVTFAKSGSISLSDSTYYVGSADANGWQKVEITSTWATGATGANPHMDFYLTRGNADFYLDNIRLVSVAADGSETDILAANNVNGNFDTDTPADDAPVFDPDTSADEANNAAGWTASPWNLTANNSYSFKTNTAESYQGSKSMHLVHQDDPAATNDRWALRVNNDVNAPAMQLYPNTTYKMSFYAKVMYNGAKTTDANAEAVQVVLDTMTDLSDHAVGEPDANGWQLYEKTVTTGATVSNARSGWWIQSGDADIYLDNITIVPTATTNAELASKGQTIGENILSDIMTYMDEDSIVEPPFAPSTAGDSTKALNSDTAWTYSDWQSRDDNWATTGTAASYKVNTNEAHTGSGSMHLIHYNNTNTNKDQWTIRTNNGADATRHSDLVLQGGNTYKLSFWAKVNTNDKQDGATTKDALMVTLDTTYNLSDIKVGDPVDGWQYYEKEVTLAASLANIRWGFYVQDGNVDAYIDDISLQVKEDGAYGKNLLLKNASYQKMAYLDTDTPLPAEPGDNVPDLTEAANPVFGRFKWETSAWNLTSAVAANEGATPGHSAMVTSEVSYSGKNSLHIKYQQGSAVGELRDIKVRPMGNENQFPAGEGTPLNMVSGTTYTLTLYLKVVKNTADGLYVNGPSGSTEKLSTSSKFTDMGNGWYKFEETAAASNSRVCIGCNAGAVEVYLDDVTCVDASGTDILDYSQDANNLIHYTSTFEMSGTALGASKVYAPRMFDEDGVEATELSTALNGKTMTVATVISNYAETGVFTGQLIVCLYKGDSLEDVVLSDIETATTDGGSVKIFTDIELPSDLTGYTMKAFVWDSYSGMDPLTTSKTF